MSKDFWFFALFALPMWIALIWAALSTPLGLALCVVGLLHTLAALWWHGYGRERSLRRMKERRQ